MLNATPISFANTRMRAQQKGVVLMIALIVLVAMTLAAIAMIRSVDTTNVIAGNLAFKQASSKAGDAGVEAAINWLEANTGAALWANNYPNGYSATTLATPTAGQTWDQYWTTVIDPAPLTAPVAAFSCSAANSVCTLPTDAAGNTTSYSIARLCSSLGDPTTAGTGCAISTTVATANASSSSQGTGEIALQYSSQVYYRITTRTVGPRNTVSYIQTIIAM